MTLLAQDSSLLLWVLVSGIFISGFAVSFLGCIGATREGTKVVHPRTHQEQHSIVTSDSSNSISSNSNSNKSSNSNSNSQQQQKLPQSHHVVGSSSSGDVAPAATTDSREVWIPGGKQAPDNIAIAVSSATSTTDTRSSVESCRALGVDAEGGQPTQQQPPPQQQQQQQQPQQGASIGESPAGGDSQGLTREALGSGQGSGRGSGEGKSTVQNIFESFDNLSELLGLEKGAERNMTSEDLWQLASAATKKRLQALSGDLEARSIKLDRKIRDAKRRKPSKHSAAAAATAAAAAAAAGGGEGARAHQHGGKGRGRRSAGGGRNERNGGAAAGGATGVAAAAAAAAAAAEVAAVAKSEHVKALNVDNRAIQDLHRSLDEMLGDWDRELGSGLDPPPPLNTPSSTCSTRGLAAPVPTPAQRATNPLFESVAGVAGLSSSACYFASDGRGSAADGGRVGSGTACYAGAGALLPGSGGVGAASGGAARGAPGAQYSGPLAAASRAPATGGERGKNKSNNSKNSSGRSSSGFGSSVSSKNHGNGKCHGGSGGGGGGSGVIGGGGDHMATLPRDLPRNNSSTVGGSSSSNALHANMGTRCFPPPLPSPAVGVVQEARAFAPGQHLAVLQALLNGEEGQGDKGFHSDSDSEREEGADGGGAATGEGKEVGVGGGM